MDVPRRLQKAIWSVHTHALKGYRVPTRRAPAVDLSQAIEVVACEGGEHRGQKAEICCARAGHRHPLRLESNARAALEQARVQANAEPAPCVVETTPLVPDFDHTTDTLELTTWSTVNRPLAQIARVVDPRSWGKCSDFFDPERTYRVRMTADGHARRDASGEFGRYDGPEPIGTTWAGLLRERFDGPGIAVDTVLCIDFVATPKDVSLDYSLYLSDRCTLGPFTDIGGVHMNTGRLSARATPDGRTRVDVYKKLRFRDYTPGDSGRWVDFGDALSLLIVLMGVVIDDKFVLKLCCDLNDKKH